MGLKGLRCFLKFSGNFKKVSRYVSTLFEGLQLRGQFRVSQGRFRGVSGGTELVPWKFRGVSEHLRSVLAFRVFRERSRRSQTVSGVFLKVLWGSRSRFSGQEHFSVSGVFRGFSEDLRTFLGSQQNFQEVAMRFQENLEVSGCFKTLHGNSADLRKIQVNSRNVSRGLTRFQWFSGGLQNSEAF